MKHLIRHAALAAAILTLAAVQPAAAQDLKLFYKTPVTLDLTKAELGPTGAAAAPASDIKLTPEEEAKIRDGHYTAALLWAVYLFGAASALLAAALLITARSPQS